MISLKKRMMDKYSTVPDSDNNFVLNSTKSMSEFHFQNPPPCSSSSVTVGVSGSGISKSKRNIDDDDDDDDGFSSYHHHQQQHNPRKKKRTKLIKVHGNDDYGYGYGGSSVRSAAAAASVPVSANKPKYGKKPDPNAPKITKPCSECGKKFWSWKALFGHMRCHPERQWRGINPPPTFKHNHHHHDEDYRQQQQPSSADDSEIRLTAEDHEIATCLLLLANGRRRRRRQQLPISGSQSPTTVTTSCNATSQGTEDPLLLACRRFVVDHSDISTSPGAGAAGGVNCGRFECSSCKKVFGSHQALGGHRASHKNVKGCFAIHKNEDGDGEEEEMQELIIGNDDELHLVPNKDGSGGDDDYNNNTNSNGHKCSICLRVFSSGQALGGHKRCHWEKSDDPLMEIPAPFNPFTPKDENWGLDLNLPPTTAAVRDDSLLSSAIALDLKLGL